MADTNTVGVGHKTWSVPPPPKPDLPKYDKAAVDKALPLIDPKTEFTVTEFNPEWLRKPWVPYVPDKIVSYKTPIDFCSLGGYRRFCLPWWKDVLSYPFIDFWRDCRAFIHRGRYGWAPRDTWNLESHLAQVLAGSLNHLAEHTHGAPSNYPNTNGHSFVHAVDEDKEGETIFTRWRADLKRWAKAFADYYDWQNNSRDLGYDLADDSAKSPTGRKAYFKAEKEIKNNVTKAFREIGPWFQSLWD